MDTSFLTISEIKKLLADKKVSAEAVIENSLERIKKHDHEINAFLHVANDEALAEAHDIKNKKGRLAGIPIAVKNNILVAGRKATAGSKMLQEYEAVYDATVIKRLREAGAIIIGETNMDEFAMGSSTENSAFFPTKNPWNIKKTPGGSSGGSIAAVAAGFVPAALGTDTGGSVRQPAALCGVVGLKPTYGRVSRYGAIALGSSLDQIGVCAHTVEDVAEVFSVIAGNDDKDATAVETDVVIPELIPNDIKGLRVGVPKEYFVKGMDVEVKKAVLEAIEVLRNNGAEVKEISLPHTEYAIAAYYIVMPCEVSSNLARMDGIRFGHAVDGENLLTTYLKARGEGFGAETKRRIMLGSFALSKGYSDAYYKKALRVRELIRRDFEEAFKHVDVIITPTSPTVAWDIGDKFNDPLAMYLSDIYTVSANLAGIPALSLPCGFDEGLPIGLQLMAKPFDETCLFRAGKFYQSVTDWHKKQPKM
ncbi:MAG: Asp-tRNA(Asn)/Glu-tRNA(Gln) amidotransferase subunit GatA [Patescibacteria group bacterium]|jgi:aspartyl-tRNA(Asn)/glutamyl-tRNA(Gln) amidotransferase subunit A